MHICRIESYLSLVLHKHRAHNQHIDLTEGECHAYTKKIPYGLKELIGSFTCTTYMNATKKKVNRKSFQKSPSKNKIQTDECLLQM